MLYLLLVVGRQFPQILIGRFLELTTYGVTTKFEATLADGNGICSISRRFCDLAGFVHDLEGWCPFWLTTFKGCEPTHRTNEHTPGLGNLYQQACFFSRDSFHSWRGVARGFCRRGVLYGCVVIFLETWELSNKLPNPLVGRDPWSLVLDGFRRNPLSSKTLGMGGCRPAVFLNGMGYGDRGDPLFEILWIFCRLLVFLTTKNTQITMEMVNWNSFYQLDF